jgi:primosomal protein N' (replication factor Y)
MTSPTYIEVAFPIPLNKTFHYRAEGGKIGCRVSAPFGPNKTLVGYVVGRMTEKPAFPTKEITQWLDEEPFIDETMFALAKWVADRYLCSWGEALACVVPANLSAPKRPVKNPSPLVGEDLGGGGKNAISTPHPQPSPTRGEELELTSEQTRALEPLLISIQAKEFHPYLIRGITDSGKTEIYLRAIDQVIAQGRQALYLLPEIALTPPFTERLVERFGQEKVGIWHSGLSGGQRYRTWTAVRKGEIQVLLGARSAVFAPFPKLGLIVVDEEHESSYKQEDRPRYHTRDVALKRAELSSATLIMGSATPSLESYWKAKRGVYTLLEMTSRVEQRSLPPVELIDQRHHPHPAVIASVAKQSVTTEQIASSALPIGGTGKPPRNDSRGNFFSVFSEPLKLAIEQRLARREQVMLFVNRRGFTPFLRCGKCGWVSRCSRCSTTMTLHLDFEGKRTMQCHACSQREPFPVQCPSCRSMRLHQYGIGTQKVEEEIKKLFPFVKVARLDRDIVRHTSGGRPPSRVAGASERSMYETIYRGFFGGEFDILVGTQMIAKGFNFPNVTLVGVIDADVSLHLPDFRSAERTFDLLTQVAGRTGRGKAKGKVLVQTHHPDHYALQAAREHDYVQFYEREIQDRERMNYPPFCRLINIVLRSAKEPAVREAAEKLADVLLARFEDTSVLGPAPAPYSRLRNQFRYQILIKGSDQTLEPCLGLLRGYRPAKAFMTVDVDPADLL